MSRRSCSRWIVVAIVIAISIRVSAQTSSEIRAYIDKYRQVALDQEKEFGIPAPITLAQGILESGAGTSKLTVNSNNHFGIKALGGWGGGVYLAWDDEPVKSRFRTYASAEESFRDHSLVLKNSPRYRSLFSKSVFDYRSWAVGLQAAGYATAPNYAKALIGYIDAYAIYAVNGGVKLRPGKTVTVTKTVLVEGAMEEWQMDETEVTEEQEEIARIVSRFVVEINDVRCTLLYPGQTLATVAQRYDISKKKLLEYNEARSERDIQEGSVVYLAPKRNRYKGIQDYYVVKEGESLYSVSQQFGLKMASLGKMNGKSMLSRLQAGEKLRLK